MIRRAQLKITLIALFLHVSGPSVPAGDWTGWLGPHRNGFVDGFDPPNKWPTTLSKTWSLDVGQGYGSPLVVGQNVYLHSRVGDDEILRCVDLETGSEVWAKRDSVPFRVRGGGEFHGAGPKACPTYSDGRVFTLSITGELIARSSEDGSELWRSEYGRKYAQNHPHWGTSSSPIVDGDHIFMHFGNDESGELVALNVESGDEIWSSGTAGASYSSALVADLQGVRQIVEWNHQELAGVDIETGQKLWSQPFPHESHNQNMPTPSIFKGTVLLGAENRGLHCFAPQLEEGQWSVAKVWSQPGISLDMSSAVVNNGLLFGMSHYGKGRLFCVRPEDGSILWQSEGRYGQNAMFLAIRQAVIGLNDSGVIQVVAAHGKRLDQLAQWKVSDEPTWAPPVLLKDGFLIKDRSNLMRLKFASDQQ